MRRFDSHFKENFDVNATMLLKYIPDIKNYEAGLVAQKAGVRQKAAAALDATAAAYQVAPINHGGHR